MKAKFLNRVGFGLFLSLFFTSVVSATPIDLKTYRPDQLLKVSEELDPHYRRIQQSQKNPNTRSVGEDMASIRVLRKYALIENANTIMARLKLDIASPPNLRSPELRELAMDALLDMITEEDDNVFLDIVHTEEMLRRIGENSPEHLPYVVEVADELRQLRNRIEQKPAAPRLPTFDELRDAPRKDRAAANRALDFFQEILEDRIKGQPELIEALTAMEWESRFIQNPNRSPDIIYLMGSPGTGKDTAAEAFADALNGFTGAFNKHLYRMPIMRTQADLWQVLGSATGYIGSGQFPPFLDFLVAHSGGKYILEKSSNGTAIKENPDWKGEPLTGFARPDQAVVFINEFHNWSKEIKDVLVKQALEKGIFNVNNPNGGLNQIQVPVRFVIASNEGIGLVTSRESNGQRFGKSLSYAEMNSKWERVHLDKKRLKTEIMTGNGASRDPSGGRVTGISEELLNRIPDRYLILMRPLEPTNLQAIATVSLEATAKLLLETSPLNPGLDIDFDDNVAAFVQEYDYNAEDNARPIAGKVKSLVVEPLIRFLRDNNLDSSAPLKMDIKVVQNDDGSSSLEIDVKEQSGPYIGKYTALIPVTEKDITKPVVSDEVIDRLVALPARIKQRVFGVDIIADRISERVLALANQTTSSNKSARNASTLVLMGLSSTGKTELAKAVTEALTGDEKNALIIDFSQVQTLQEFKARVLGLRDAYGNAIPSDFMMHYDRLDGDVVVIFDELSNVRDPDLMKSLYDFFREPILSTFSDGKERNMSRVKVIVTGNSGIELYKNVPRWVSMEQQMRAWDKISKDLANDIEAQRAVLEKSFPEPLINRWGMNNIFFVPPHTYKSLKQVAILKLQSALKNLRPSDGRRGWNIGFVNAAELEEFLHLAIERAFNLREQGASIDSFMKDDFQAVVEAKLLFAKAEPGSSVLIKKAGNDFQILTSEKKLAGVIKLGPAVNDEEKKEVLPSKVAQVLTAYHEVGHALAQKILMNGLSEPDLVSIVPGVTRINNEYVAYAGVAVHKFLEQSRGTREWYIRQVAILAAGETAERMVTVDDVHSAGKSNDMMRATSMIEAAILHYGLSETWGTEAVPQGVSLRDYVNGFSDSKKRKFETEVNAMLNEGRLMARELIQANYHTVFVPMAKELARKGELNYKEMQPFWQHIGEFDDSWSFKNSWLGKKVADFVGGRSKRRDGVLLSPDLMPESVAVVADIVHDAKVKLYNEVPIPAESFQFFDPKDFAVTATLLPDGANCNDLLK